MKKKQFKAESKKLLDLMVNSIYTHKEIFLRELISNASDAEDKLHFRLLTDNSADAQSEELMIRISPDKEARTITITDNGIGMTAAELENNLGVIARSGSQLFKTENADSKDIDIIGQFGVGFYAAFMVSSKVRVVSKAYGSDEADCWESEGADGFTVSPCEKESHGTEITLYLKEDTDEVKYSQYLEPYTLSALVKKYSNYIRYPIKMMMPESRPVEGKEGEYETVETDTVLNSMLPLWKKNKNEITKEEYNAFYKDAYHDYDDPLKVIHTKTEGSATFDALLFIPSHAPFDYYTKDYEKGLQLYSKGVLITEKCADLLPDHFNFVRGLVDSEDLSLNISREMLQHDHQLKLIAKTIAKKIKSELLKLLKDDRESYEKFFKAFGASIKFGVYNDYGVNKDELKELLMFVSSKEEKLVTLEEYVSRMKEDQKTIYYAAADSIEKAKMLPQVDSALAKGYEVLYFTDYMDEFAVRMLMSYNDKTFVNVCSGEADFETDEEKEENKTENESNEELFNVMKEALGDKVSAVRFTHKLGKHPSCLSNEGFLSAEMEKVLNAMPGNNGAKAELVLEINAEHPIAGKLKAMLPDNKEKLADYAKLLYNEARLIGGMSIEDPVEFSTLICSLM
ncbi:MAG: molecular chaperone HtpG [Oscillospiraceae bacterium]|nr:molecular chaperone HtpG [Oscillospiraceae bacterium]